MKRAILAAVLLAAAPAAALDEWTAADTSFQLGVTTLLVADWALTVDFLSRPVPGVETNALLGPHPSRLAVSAYMAGWIVGSAAVARILSQPWRRIWQVTIGAVEVAAVGNNLVVFGGFHGKW